MANKYENEAYTELLEELGEMRDMLVGFDIALYEEFQTIHSQLRELSLTKLQKIADHFSIAM